jgi:hypothetical protein
VGQLWLFIVIPLLGGAAAALVAPLFRRAHAEVQARPTTNRPKRPSRR